MANLMNKFIKNRSSSLRFITSLKTLHPLNPTNLITLPLGSDLNNSSSESYFQPIIKDDSQIFYPSFHFCHCPDSVLLSSGFCQSGDLEIDDARTVWADSVKKKRKKKMNKHKYKKLRKRLRRKARS